MVRNRRGYSRYYIILQEAQSGYRLKEEKAAAGYVKLEIRDHKGRILTYVQDMRLPVQPGERYLVAMVTAEGDQAAVLGDMEIGADGIGQQTWIFDADDVGDTGYPLEEFDGLVVLAYPVQVRSGSGIPIILSGNFKKNKALELKSIAADVLGIPVETISGEIGDETVTETIEQVEVDEQVPQDNIGTMEQMVDEQYEASSEVLQQIDGVHQNGGVKFQAPILNEEDDGSMPQRAYASTPEYKPFSAMVSEGIRGFVERNAVSDIFSENIADSKWCAVAVDPTYAMQWNWYKYDHYLIGLIYEGENVKYVAYGMPGRFCLGEQPFQGMTGYVYWYPAKGQKRQYGDFGYWVAYIDAQNGRIAYPF
ncbi:MAG: hypothetical protein PWP48_583 [Clostridiales bacterium]|jgi:hypothetical protein|nr:hypothetical protein [Clostridiales bacterium]MDK2991350.1 hypothetical protein [Clostridiales bacterium]